MEKKYEITEQLVQQIIRYLSTKPYIEVAQLLQQIIQLKTILDSVKDTKEEKNNAGIASINGGQG